MHTISGRGLAPRTVERHGPGRAWPLESGAVARVPYATRVPKTGARESCHDQLILLRDETSRLPSKEVPTTVAAVLL